MRHIPVWRLTRLSEIMSQTRQRRTTPPRRVKEEIIKGKCKKYLSKVKAWFITAYANCWFKEKTFLRSHCGYFRGMKPESEVNSERIIALIPQVTVQTSLNCLWLFFKCVSLKVTLQKEKKWSVEI